MKPMMLQRQLPETAAPFRRVLACGPPAEAAILLAQAAPILSGPETMLRVVEVRGPEQAPALEHLVRRLEQRGVTVIREAVAHVDAAAIVAMAERDDHDLVISRRAPLRGEASRRTMDRLLVDRCPCALWLGAIGETRPPRRVAAAVDPGEETADRSLARRVLSIAHAVADHAGSELHIVHAWVPFGAHLLRRRVEADELAGYVGDRADLAQAAVHELLSDVPLSAPLRRDHVHLAQGDFDRILAQHAQALDLDLVVMGTRGRQTRVGRLLVEPWAHRVLRRMGSSVLVVKPQR